jgi:hypothetical protein
VGKGFQPCAPLYGWVKGVLVKASLLQFSFYGFAEGPIAVATDVDRARREGRDHERGHFVDLRHGQVRYALLRAMEDAGHICAWALGVPWTPLTDEQAGRLVAEMIRRLGPGAEVPKVPRAPLPVSVLGRVWVSLRTGEERRDSLAAAAGVRVAIGRAGHAHVRVVGHMGQDFEPAWDEQGRPVWRSSPTVILIEDLEAPAPAPASDAPPAPADHAPTPGHVGCLDLPRAGRAGCARRGGSWGSP